MSVVAKLRRFAGNPRAARALLGSLKPTFSQYGEDRVLHELLHPGMTGTYVDVGSHHPYEGSNTYALYLRGWRGLTIDPNPGFAALYAHYRPHEPHLVEGVSESRGDLNYHWFENSVYNTLSDKRASDLASGGIVPLRQTSVVTRPLGDMVDEQLGGRPIDLLSVDCEGLDLEVIRSLDLEARRPTVIIMEDYARLVMFRSGQGRSPLHEFLTASRYVPFAQLAFSALYVAEDFRALMARSAAFDPERIQGGILSS